MKYKVLDQRLNAYITFTASAGILCIPFIIMAYSVTIISIWALLSIIAGATVISTVVGHGLFTRAYLYNKIPGYIFCFLYSLLSYGLLACLAYLLINYSFAGPVRSTQQFKVIDEYSMSGPKRARSKRKLVVVINYEGVGKELVFDNNDYKKSQHNYFSTVSLVTQKGLLGFDVIESQKINYQNADLVDGAVMKVEPLSASRWAVEYFYIVDSVNYTGYDTIEFPTAKGNLFLIKYNKHNPAIHTIEIN